MFQFRRFPTYTYLIQCTFLQVYCRGFPHSEISGSKLICSSPKLIAACHVLHRLLMPRHSPCALYSLTLVEQPFLSCSLFDHELCRHHRSLQLATLFYPLTRTAIAILLLKFHNIAVCPLLLALVLSFCIVQFSRC